MFGGHAGQEAAGFKNKKSPRDLEKQRGLGFSGGDAGIRTPDTADMSRML